MGQAVFLRFWNVVWKIFRVVSSAVWTHRPEASRGGASCLYRACAYFEKKKLGPAFAGVSALRYKRLQPQSRKIWPYKQHCFATSCSLLGEDFDC